MEPWITISFTVLGAAIPLALSVAGGLVAWGSYKASMASMDRRIAALEGEIAAIAKMSGLLERLDERTGALNQRLDRLDSRLGWLDQTESYREFQDGLRATAKRGPRPRSSD